MPNQRLVELDVETFDRRERLRTAIGIQMRRSCLFATQAAPRGMSMDGRGEEVEASGVKSRKSFRNCVMSRRIRRKFDLKRRSSGVRIRQSTIRPCIVSVVEIHENYAKMDNASFPINSDLA